MKRILPPLHGARRLNPQRGATLLITMIMVILLTLMVVAAIRISNVNLRITGNFQWQKVQELLTDGAIEQVISAINSFDGTAVQNGTATDYDICADGRVVALSACTLLNPKIGTVTSPKCTGSRVADGYTIKQGELAPVQNDWLLTAVAIDSLTGAKVAVHRGVSVRMLADTCPE